MIRRCVSVCEKLFLIGFNSLCFMQKHISNKLTNNCDLSHFKNFKQIIATLLILTSSRQKLSFVCSLTVLFSNGPSNAFQRTFRFHRKSNAFHPCVLVYYRKSFSYFLLLLHSASIRSLGCVL